MNDTIATSELRRLLQRHAQQLTTHTPAEGQTLTSGQRIAVLTAALDRLDAMRAELLAQRQAAIANAPALQMLAKIDSGEAEVPRTEEIADRMAGDGTQQIEPDEEGWEPESHPEFTAQMPQIAKTELQRLLTAPADERIAFLFDPRSVHRTLYQTFATECDVCAGRYRGENIAPLTDWRAAVHFKDGTLAKDIIYTPPQQVPATMNGDHRERVEKFLTRLDMFDKTSLGCALADLIYNFLSLHPFANGNGHIARTMIPVLVSLTKCQLRQGWSVNPSSFNDDFKRSLMAVSSKSALPQEQTQAKVSLAKFFISWIV